MNSQLQTTWDLLPHPSSDHVVRLFARIGDKKYGEFARNVADIERFIRGSQGMNIYLAPNPTMSTLGTRHKAQDVTHWSYMFLDLDPVCTCVPHPEGEEQVLCQTCRGEAKPFVALEAALLELGEWLGRDFKKRRPIIIDSGRGAQAWIRLDDVPLLEPGFMFAGDIVIEESKRIPGVCTAVGILRKTARKTMGYWLKRIAEQIGTVEGCRLDTSCSDLPRVMRCPGTINMKTGRETRLIEPSAVVYRGLASLLITGTPAAVFNEPDPGQFPPGTPWQMVYTDLTIKAQRYLTEGKEEPGRHETMWHTARVLAEKGIERTQTEAALRHANMILGETNALDEQAIQHALDTGYQE